MHVVNNLYTNSDATVSIPNARAAMAPDRLDAIHNDFIPHPAQFPLRVRRHVKLPWLHRGETRGTAGDVGLSFRAQKPFPVGTRLELEIPLRGEIQKFTATVVLLREEADGFEIGLWFEDPADAGRARIVEKICHTECYLRSKTSANN